jgi:hypothetical protein
MKLHFEPSFDHQPQAIKAGDEGLVLHSSTRSR